MMLTGGPSVSAASYMQTIFRVQSAGSINGKQKERCYVFDFAPDRALTVLSEVHNLRQKGKRRGEESQAALGEFLNFCPVIALSGTGMTQYDVPKMMRQIKRLTVDNAIKSGFDDESIYRSDTGIVMGEDDVHLFHELGGILTQQKKAKLPAKVKVNGQGLTDEEYAQAEQNQHKPKRQLTPEEQKRLANKLSNPRTWDREGERMKFDAIVGNPPYQIMDGGYSASAVPIYQNFVEQSMALQPAYVSMLIPSRWFAGGRGLDIFREMMMNNQQLKKLHDYSLSRYIFPSADISGGICYFLNP